ncbi:hypothetical protein PQX77_008317 [Marasmius sp. AFHP31]|nr:hypothetical protein PQX77_008317 [Marasmius sp. AFHP31]
MSVPPFLTVLPDQHSQDTFINALFKHQDPLGNAHSLWWPCKSPRAAVLFIPGTILIQQSPRSLSWIRSLSGNPGLVEFYIPFLSALQNAKNRLVILAHAHINHTPGIVSPAAEHSVTIQVQAAIEALDSLKKHYDSIPIIIIGHSVGAYITLQVLKSRPGIVSQVCLVCPTISNIALTPNGRRLSWLFRPPLPFLISKLSYLLRAVPSVLINTLFSDWPQSQISVLNQLLQSPSSIHACLSMAHDEMKSILDLDPKILRDHHNVIRMLFVQGDDWVGKEESAIQRSFEGDPGLLKIVRRTDDVPHAFCIKHGDEVAAQCAEWLTFMDDQ